MKVSRKQIALLISLFILSIIAVQVNSDQIEFKESRHIALSPEAILDERCLPSLSANGKVGFISSVTTGSVMSFNTTSGRIMSSIIVGETAGAVSLVETASRRLLAVPSANDPDHDKPASIAIIDATKPKEMQIMTLIVLPKTAHITASTRVFLTSDARLGIIASSFPEPTLYSFKLETGQVISQLAIIGQPSEIALRSLGQNSLIAISSATANSLSFVNLDADGLLNQISFFSPENAHITESNNPVISNNGRIAYITASEGEMLFSVDTANGMVINSLKIASTPQRLSLARNQNREELVAITLARDSANHQSAGVLIILSLRGQLQVKSKFAPPEQIDFSKVNNIVFSDDATRAFVGSKSGILFAFSTETGELQSYQSFGNELMSIALNSLAQKVIAVKRGINHDEIVIADFEIVNVKEPENGEIKSIPQPSQYSSTSLDMTSEISSNYLNETLFDSKDLSKVYMHDAYGRQIAVDPWRVRLRSSKTLEIALDGKLTEFIERGGWKFNVRNKPINDKPKNNLQVATQIYRAFIKRSKNNDGYLRLKLVGINFHEGNIVEFVKGRSVLYKQLVRSVSNEELVIKIPEFKLISLGQFSVRMINSHKISSNIIEVEPITKDLSGLAGSLTPSLALSVDPVTIKTSDDHIKVIVKTTAKSQYSDFILDNPFRIVVDVKGTPFFSSSKIFKLTSSFSPISRIRVGNPSKGIVRIVLDSTRNTPYKVYRNGDQLIITTGKTL